MEGRLFCCEQIEPLLADGVTETAPDEVVDFVREDVDEVGGMGEQILVENDFAASEKTRRENLFSRPVAKGELAAMRAQLPRKTNA